MSQRVPQLKIVAVVIAYKAERTITQTLAEIPREWVDEIIVGDDCSPAPDRTYELARQTPGVVALRHERNQRMGGNQKLLYDRALADGADIVVLLHGDNQYDAQQIPAMIAPIVAGEADAVLGSRILGKATHAGGMPLYKFLGNHLLNFLQNRCYGGLRLSDYATGYKAYSRRVLQTVPYRRNRSDFIFDEELNTQIIHFGFRLAQVPVPTRYFPEASSVNFRTSVHYGLFTLWTVLKFRLHRLGWWRAPFLQPQTDPA